jgi:hypothetical protein
MKTALSIIILVLAASLAAGRRAQPLPIRRSRATPAALGTKRLAYRHRVPSRWKLQAACRTC